MIYDFVTVSAMPEYRRDVPVDVPLDLSTPTGMSCIGAYGVNITSQTMCQNIVFY